MIDDEVCIFDFVTQVAPLGSLTLVSNVFFAPIVLGEKLDSKDWIGTGAIVVGSALAVAFASHESATYTYANSLHLVPILKSFLTIFM
jgi:drug/metabolite transporter (DMT)-like permease